MIQIQKECQIGPLGWFVKLPFKMNFVQQPGNPGNSPPRPLVRSIRLVGSALEEPKAYSIVPLVFGKLPSRLSFVEEPLPKSARFDDNSLDEEYEDVKMAAEDSIRYDEWLLWLYLIQPAS
jgi:hypothetical protein